MRLGRALTAVVDLRTPALPVAICRVGIGVAAFGRGLKTARDLYLLEHDPRVIPVRLYDWAPTVSTMPETVLVSAIWLGAAVGLAVGYRARLCAGVLTASIAFVHVVDQNFWAHHMYFLGLVTLLFTFLESDAVFSLRAWRDPTGVRTVALWPVLLLKIQLSLAYFFTAVAKLNPVFLSGDVIGRRMILPDDVIGPAGLAVTSGLAVASEFFLSLGLWVRRLRPWALVVGLGLHVLVPFVMGFYVGLLVFSVVVLSLYVLYLDEAELARVSRWVSR